MDLSDFDLQKDNKKLALGTLAIGLLSFLITIYLIGVTYFNFFFWGFVIFVICVFVFSRLDRYCEKCGLKMSKDYSNGLLCENHYCISCKRKVKIPFRNKKRN